jgi:hypothetical protein
MPESRGRRPKKSTQPSGNTSAKDKRTKKEDKTVEARAERRKKSLILEVWKDIWAIVGPAVALTAFAFLLWPQVQIEPSAHLDPAKPLATQFKITNTGRIPVYNVTFRCEYGFPLRFEHSGLDVPGTELSPIPLLRPGQPATRSCAAPDSDAGTPGIRATAMYEWPIIKKADAVPAFFRVVKGQSSYFLLPDEAPRGWQPGLTINGPPK